MKLYEVKVYKIVETEWDDIESFLGTYYTHAASPKQAWARIKYKNRLYTRHYENSNVYFRGEYKEVEKK